jgi:hypothetical protein
MSNVKNLPYDTRLNILHGALEIIAGGCVSFSECCLGEAEIYSCQILIKINNRPLEALIGVSGG